jgi:hypothetical protein
LMADSPSITLPHPLPQHVVQTLLLPDLVTGDTLDAGRVSSISDADREASYPTEDGATPLFDAEAESYDVAPHEAHQNRDSSEDAASVCGHVWQDAQLPADDSILVSNSSDETESCRARILLLEAALESERNRYDSDMQIRIDGVYGVQEVMAAVTGSMLARLFVHCEIWLQPRLHSMPLLCLCKPACALADPSSPANRNPQKVLQVDHFD